MRGGGREDNTALSGQSEKRGIARLETLEFRALENAAGMGIIEEQAGS